MLPELILKHLDNPQAWFGIRITHELPNIERIWLNDATNKFCLHRILPLDGQKPYYHRHPWACETTIIHGAYFMDVGYGEGPTPPPVAMRVHMTAGSSYVMDNPHAWHTVEPENGPTYTLFRITKRWDSVEPPDCRQTHQRFNRKQIAALLQEFKAICQIT